MIYPCDMNLFFIRNALFSDVFQPETQYLLSEEPLAQNGTRIYKYSFFICLTSIIYPCDMNLFFIKNVLFSDVFQPETQYQLSEEPLAQNGTGFIHKPLGKGLNS